MPRHHYLGHLKGGVAPIAHDLGADLDQFLPRAGQRPRLRGLRHRQHKVKVKQRYSCADAAFANQKIYEFLEAEGMGYVIRLPANRVLRDEIAYLLKRPPWVDRKGRSSSRGCHAVPLPPTPSVLSSMRWPTAPRPLRHLPDGRGRGARANVPGNPVIDLAQPRAPPAPA
jgi:hypothetical protein